MAEDPRLRRAADRVDSRVGAQMAPGAVVESGTRAEALLLFVGTDLPGEDVLDLLEASTAMSFAEIAAALVDASDPVGARAELHGALISTFFLGYFAREEVERG